MGEVSLKDLKERYMMLGAWSILHETDKNISVEKFTKVFATMGQLELDLKEQGVSDDEIDKLNKRTKEFANSNFKDLSMDNRERMVRLVFGNKKG